MGGLDQVAFDPELDVWMHEAMAKVGVTYIYILFNILSTISYIFQSILFYYIIFSSNAPTAPMS